MKNIHTIPPHQPFLTTLAHYILSQMAAEGEDYTRALILLPSRRACRSLRTELLKQTHGKPLLLPRIQPIGDIGEGDSPFDLEIAVKLRGIPPAIPRTRRHMLLMQLVAGALKHRGGEHAFNMVQAIELAADLVELFDDMQRQNLSLDALKQLVPDDYAIHWQQTILFLEIFLSAWPKILEQEGTIDPVERRNRVMRALSEQWQTNPPDYPIVIAGSTGSTHATQELIILAATLPSANIILPGLDMALPEDEWEAITETHPQFHLKQLLAAMEVEREGVSQLTFSEDATAIKQRYHLLSRSLIPASYTYRWQEDTAEALEEAVTGLEYVTCKSAEDEAETVAVITREALENPELTVCIVTGDRQLAKRIVTAGQWFGINIDDSAGQPLHATPVAVFLRLVVEALQPHAGCMELLSLLQHPFSTCGMARRDCLEAARWVDLHAVRGSWADQGISHLFTRLEAMELPSAVQALLAFLKELYASSEATYRRQTVSLHHLLKFHIELAERIAAAKQLWKGEEGIRCADFIASLLESSAGIEQVEPGMYPGVFDALLARQTMRSAYGAHPRVKLLSPQEARLETADIMILAGMNEGVWPTLPEASPWMSRPMLRALGMELPEAAISRAGHDFYMVMHAPRIVITRACVQEDTLAEPSRWIQRLLTCLRVLNPTLSLWHSPYADWVRLLNQPQDMPILAPPQPTPPIAARPVKFSVTEMELLQRDPYAIYAKRILRLKPLDEAEKELDAAEFGMLIHHILERFVQEHPRALPEYPLEILLAIGRDAFAPLWSFPRAQLIWWTQFENIAAWFISCEQERRATGCRVASERNVAHSLTLGGVEYTLTARIDRVEKQAGRYRIIDYKTGQVPTNPDIVSGIACQLPLSGWIIEQSQGAGAVSDLEYWKLSGKDDDKKIIAFSEKKNLGERADLMVQAGEGVLRLLTHYQDVNASYPACPDEDNAPRYNNYSHLERMDEWRGS